MNKKVKEWTVDAPWGKIALISWGDPAKRPILMVHGYMDTAATFTALVQHLPDSFYYVAVDLPGHGKSEPFPAGVMISQMTMVEVLKQVIDFMSWKKLTIIGHSMGAVISTFYSFLNPGRVVKMIHIDAKPPISFYYTIMDFTLWSKHTFISYYENWENLMNRSNKKYVLDELISNVVRNRLVSEEKAQILLSRSIRPIDEEKCELTFDLNSRKIRPEFLTPELLKGIILGTKTPTLNILAKTDTSVYGIKESLELMEDISRKHPYYHIIFAEGSHDLHVSNPETFAHHIVEFLYNKKSLQIQQSKI